MNRNTRWTRHERIGIAAILAAAGVTLSGAAHAQQSCGWSAAPGLDRSQGDEILAMEVFDAGDGPTLYAAGEILRSDGTQLAKWDSDAEGWDLIPAGMGGSITALAAADDGLYVGGNFEFAGNAPANRIARWDGSSWTALDGGIHGDDAGNIGEEVVVHDLAIHGGYLYVAGNFDDADGLADTQNIARWNLENGGWSSVGSADDSVNALTVHKGELYAAGRFEAIGGAAELRIARLNDEHEWQPLENEFDFTAAGTILALASIDGTLYAGGNFTFTDNDVTFNQIAGLDESGWFPLGEGLTNTPPDGAQIVHTLTEYHDDAGNPVLVVGGRFSQVGGSVDANHIATWDGNNWSALSGGVNNTVRSLATFNDAEGQTLFVGGAFETADGIDSEVAARWVCDAGVVLPDPDTSTIVAARNAITSYSGETTITVTLRDANGNTLGEGRNVVIETDHGTLEGPVNDEGGGQYTQLLIADFNEQATVTAIADGVSLNDSAIVSFVPVHPGESTIELSTNQTLPGGLVDITVTPRNEAGSPIGAGFDVVLDTTLGQLIDNVADNDDGTYTQTVEVNAPGTAVITASVNGMELDTAASLAVLDPEVYGDVVGFDENSNPIGYFSIQDAVDAAKDDGLVTVLVGPGVYNETVLIDGLNDLVVEGVAASDPVVLRGFVVSGSDKISIRNVDVVASASDGIRLLGRNNANAGIEILDSRIKSAAGRGLRIDQDNQAVSVSGVEITGNSSDGIRIDRSVSDVLIEGSTISDNDGDGLRLRRDSALIHVIDSEISGNGSNGLQIDRDVTVTIVANTITNNGLSSGGGDGYGISLQRSGGGGSPELITVLNNVIADNNGQPKAGRSDENIRNYDQMFDDADDQSPYTD